MPSKRFIYLEDSKNFLEEAIHELEEGAEKGDILRIRDAAEKAWNATIQATNALILKLMGT